MSNLKYLLLSGLFIFSMGMGPCELMEEMMGSDAGVDGDCGEELCENELVIEMLSSDILGFQTGAYYFALQTPDSSVYSIDCYLMSLDWGFECELGDTEAMYPYLNETADTLWLVIAGAPTSVLLTAEFNGYSIANRELVPFYEEIYPNGEECLPVCYTAEESIAVSVW